MELKDFISSTLVQIQEGVNQAMVQVRSDANNGMINPEFTGAYPSKQTVHFDIALTTSDEDKSGAKGGIKVAGLSIGAEGSQATKSSSVSRVQFSIPFVPPHDNTII